MVNGPAREKLMGYGAAASVRAMVSSACKEMLRVVKLLERRETGERGTGKGEERNRLDNSVE